MIGIVKKGWCLGVNFLAAFLCAVCCSVSCGLGRRESLCVAPIKKFRRRSGREPVENRAQTDHASKRGKKKIKRLYDAWLFGWARKSWVKNKIGTNCEERYFQIELTPKLIWIM